MKDTGIQWIGKIPDSWSLDRLSWHMTEIKEKNIPVKTTNILSLTNKLGVVPYSEKGNQGNVAKENFEEYKLAYPNTIVANSMNILIGSVGKCDYFGCVSPVYYVFKTNENENIDFLNYIFQTEQFQKYLRCYANGILEIRLRVSSNDILKRYIAYPSIETQNKIVNYLNEKCSVIDKLIENENSQIEILKEYKKVKIKNILMDSSLFGGFSFAKRKFKTMATLCNGKEINQDGGGIPVYGSGGVFKFTNEVLMSGDSLLMGRKGTIDKPMYVFGDFWTVDTMFYTSEFKNCVGKYLYYLCLYCVDYGFFKSGSVLPSMTQTDINNIYFDVAPISVQQKIVDLIENINKKIDNLIEKKNKKIINLKEYKKSLIYEYVTGKKEVI